MNTLDAIYARRAVKHFDPEHRLSPEEEHTLLQATLQSPTSYNIQHWRLLILRDPGLRQRIRDEHGFGQSQFTDASLLVLFTADPGAWRKSPERYYRDAPEAVARMLLPMMHEFYDGRAQLQLEEAQRSIGMAMQTLMLAARSMGYESCPMIGFDIDAVAKLVGLPEDHVMGPVVAIGRGTQPPWNKLGQLPLTEIVQEDSFA